MPALSNRSQFPEIPSASGPFVQRLFARPKTHKLTRSPGKIIYPGNSGGPLLNMRAEVVGINTFKANQKGATRIGFALSTADLIDVLHRYYPSSEFALEELSAPTDGEKSGLTSGTPKSDKEKFGIVYVSGLVGAEVWVDHHPKGQTNETLRLSVGFHFIVVHDGTHADWMHWTKVSEGDELTLVPLWPK